MHMCKMEIADATGVPPFVVHSVPLEVDGEALRGASFSPPHSLQVGHVRRKSSITGNWQQRTTGEHLVETSAFGDSRPISPWHSQRWTMHTFDLLATLKESAT